MRIYVKNTRAKLHLDPIMKRRSLRLFWRCRPPTRRTRRRTTRWVLRYEIGSWSKNYYSAPLYIECSRLYASARKCLLVNEQNHRQHHGTWLTELRVFWLTVACLMVCISVVVGPISQYTTVLKSVWGFLFFYQNYDNYHTPGTTSSQYSAADTQIISANQGIPDVVWRYFWQVVVVVIAYSQLGPSRRSTMAP